jgi:chaperonin GroEL
MPKWILDGKHTQRALASGASILRRAVSSTFGPTARVVLMDRKWSGTSLVSDGFTINRELELPDPFADLAVRFLEDASEKVRSTCGDGTTTTVILAEALIAACQPAMAAGADPMALSRELNRVGQVAMAELSQLATPVENQAQLARVAGLACKDSAIGEIVAELVWKVGHDGAVLVIEGKGRTINSELQEGFVFDRGVASPAFLTDRVRVEAVLHNPYILLTGNKLESVEDILPALERILPTAQPLLVVGQEFAGEALAGLAMNKERGNLDVLAVKAPGLGGRMEERLQELAAAVGATVLPDSQTGRTLAGINPEDLGRAKRVVANRQTTRILGGDADQRRVAREAARLRQGIGEAQTDKYRRELTDRIGAMSGRTAVIRVGGFSEKEIREKIVRIRNATAAAQAALANGVVPGGGTTYARVARSLDKEIPKDDDKRVATLALRHALTAPLMTLASNSGHHGPLVLAELGRSPDGLAYDAVSGRLGPATAIGILDPLETAASALRRAVSVASAILTVDGAIVEPRASGPMGERLDMSAKYE